MYYASLIILIILNLSLIIALRKHRIFLAFYLPSFVGLFPYMSSLLLIEEGAFIIEQGIFGFANYSPQIYSIFFMISMIAFFHALKGKEKESIVHDDDIRDLVIFRILSIVAIVIAIYIRVFTQQETRFMFYSEVSWPYSQVFYIFDSIYASTFIWIIIRRPQKVLINSILYLSVGFLKFAYFGPILTAVILVFTSFLYHGIRINYGKMFLGILLLIAALITKLLIDYDKEFLDFMNRIVLQGHVFWGTINLWNENQLNTSFSAFFSDFFNMSSFRGNLDYGFYELMYAISGDVAVHYWNAGVRFTAGYPAVLIYKFGLLGSFFLHYLFSYICALLFLLRFKIALKFDSFLLFIIFDRLISMYRDFYGMGEYGYFRFKFLITLILAAMVYFIITHFRKSMICKSCQSPSNEKPFLVPLKSR